MKHLLLVALAAGGLAGQSLELSASAGAFRMGGNSLGYLGYGVGDVPSNEMIFSGGAALSFRFTYNSSRWLGHEFGAARGANTLRAPIGSTGILFDVPTTTWTGFYDLLLYAVPEESRFRPFLAAGANYSTINPRYPQVFGTGYERKFGFNYGGGVKIPVHRYFLLRVDYREYATPKPFNLIAQSGLLRQREISAGVGLVF